MPYSESERTRALEMFSKGTPYREIREEVGCCTATVRKWARSRGIERENANCMYGPKDKERAYEMYRDGSTHREIRDEIGCGSATLQRWLKESDLELRSESHGIAPSEHDTIIDKYQNGESLESLADEHGSTAETVRQVLLDNDVDTRSPCGGDQLVSDEDREEMVRLYVEEELSQRQIGDRLGLAQVTVGRHLRREGVSGDPGRGAPSGEDHGRWNGGRVDQSGYTAVMIDEDHPFYEEMAQRAGYVLEHRLKMAEAIGRPLRDTETAHHKNGKKKDNRIENLQLRQGQHGRGECAYCKECGSHNIGFE